MRFAVKVGPALEARADVLVLFHCSGEKRLHASVRAIDSKLGGTLAAALKNGEFKGDRDQLCIHRPVKGSLAVERVALVGLGARDSLAPEHLRRAGAVVAQAVRANAKTVAVALDGVTRSAGRIGDYAQALTEGMGLALYDFGRFKSSPTRSRLDRATLLVGKDELRTPVRRALTLADAILAGVGTARDLANLPGNHGQPKVLAAEARKMARRAGLKVKVLGRRELAKEEMGALLSVSLGSPHEPQLIVLEHGAPKRGTPTVCLVGKGLTFDSGGISIKPSADMDKMRYDKCGGCVVIGTMEAVARAKLPLHVIGIVPSSENMPGGDANKPGDVVRASNGKTIEILNTDAEGRLILSDALVHAQRYKPGIMIDLATLTGACMVALGSHACGMMTRDDDLAAALTTAGGETWERPWRLPLWDEYVDEMKGTTTDLKNLGGRYGGALTAAAFLESFVGDVPWAHLDIAGVSWDDSSRPYNRGKGATGFGVRLLMRYLGNLVS